MDKELWKRIVKGMEKAGFKKVVEISPDIKRKREITILESIYGQYPSDRFERKWYTNHKGYKVLFVKEKPIMEEDPYRNAIIKRIDAQIDKGLKKYGTPLYKNPLSMNERMDHLSEELVDGLQYIEHIKAGLAELQEQTTELVAKLGVIYHRLKHDAAVSPSVLCSLQEAMTQAHSIARGLINIGKTEDEPRCS